MSSAQDENDKEDEAEKNAALHKFKSALGKMKPKSSTLCDDFDEDFGIKDTNDVPKYRDEDWDVSSDRNSSSGWGSQEENFQFPRSVGPQNFRL